MTKLLKNSILIIATIIISSCSSVIYKERISQGYFPDSQSVKKLKLGMTENTVKDLLGNPNLTNPLYPNKWAYVFTESMGYEQKEIKTLALTFKKGKLSNINNKSN